jgi:hypothetical protein
MLPLGGLAPAHEVGERAEGDHILGEEQPCPDEIDRLHMAGEALKPAADESHIILMRHDSLRLPPSGAIVCSPEWRSSVQGALPAYGPSHV